MPRDDRYFLLERQAQYPKQSAPCFPKVPSGYPSFISLVNQTIVEGGLRKLLDKRGTLKGSLQTVEEITDQLGHTRSLGSGFELGIYFYTFFHTEGQC